MVEKLVHDKYINIQEAAQLLGISKATAINWSRHGYLTLIKKDQNTLLHFREVINIKNKVEKGEIKRLNSRANKKNSLKTFVPDEYFNDPEDIHLFNSIKDFVTYNELKMEESLFMLAINILTKKNLCNEMSLFKFKTNEHIECDNPFIYDEINSWRSGLDFGLQKEIYHQLLFFKIPDTGDFLGAAYQSLLSEGDKSKAGSYYTPSGISTDIANEYIFHKDSKIMDPCCGTGQFLISAATVMLEKFPEPEPSNVWGFDIDKIAVRIARINLLVKFRGFRFNPNIFHLNLIENFAQGKYSVIPKDFDLIIGNPPWGADIKIEQTSFLKDHFPKILTLESFSYFIYIGLNLLNENGILSFILPESIINIKSHSDIRSYILKESDIIKIHNLGRVFRNVFTPVVRLDLQKSKAHTGKVKIINNGQNYVLDSSRFKSNDNKVFDIHNTPEDQTIIGKAYAKDHLTLSGKSDWALGIVTGNNEKFISKQKKSGYEEIYKGKDVFKFYLNPSVRTFIKLEPEKFQQTPPVNKYRSKEKLIYRFISKKLIFAYDDKQKVTLNSANILIPKIDNYPVKLVLSFLNSSLYQFIFLKKFFTHKVLRSHIEQLPLPVLHASDKEKILKITNRLINPEFDRIHRSKIMEDLDQFIFEYFGLTDDERLRVLNQMSE